MPLKWKTEFRFKRSLDFANTSNLCLSRHVQRRKIIWCTLLGDICTTLVKVVFARTEVSKVLSGSSVPDSGNVPKDEIVVQSPIHVVCGLMPDAATASAKLHILLDVPG